MNPKEIRDLADDDEMLEIARKKIQSTLLEFRNRRICLCGRGNGLVIREKGGKESSMIRLGPEDAIRIGLRAIAQHLDKDAEG